MPFYRFKYDAAEARTEADALNTELLIRVVKVLCLPAGIRAGLLAEL